MLNDYGYIEKAIANIKEVAEKQEANIRAAAATAPDTPPHGGELCENNARHRGRWIA